MLGVKNDLRDSARASYARACLVVGCDAREAVRV